MKTKEELNALNDEKLEEVIGGQEPPEFDWGGSEFTTPIKDQPEGGHIYTPICPNKQ